MFSLKKLRLVRKKLWVIARFLPPDSGLFETHSTMAICAPIVQGEHAAIGRDFPRHHTSGRRRAEGSTRRTCAQSNVPGPAGSDSDQSMTLP